MEVLEVLGSSTVVGVSFPLDTGHHLRNKDEVNDQWRCEKRVLADIEDPTILELHLIHMKRMRLTRLSGDHPRRSQRSTHPEHACCRQQQACT